MGKGEVEGSVAQVDPLTVDDGGGDVADNTQRTKRTLKPRHVQLIGIGGAIGTGLFVRLCRQLMYATGTDCNSSARAPH